MSLSKRIYGAQGYGTGVSKGIPITAQYTGVTELEHILRQLPENLQKKAIIGAFRKGGNEIKKEHRKQLPSYLKPLKKALAQKAGKGKENITLSVGYYGRKYRYINSKGQDWDPYQLIYWHNYGTLANRSRDHNYKKARRPQTANYRGGLQAKGFVERAVQIAQPIANRKVESELDNEILKVFKKYAK